MQIPSMPYLHNYAARLLALYSDGHLSLETALTRMSDLWAITRMNAGMAQHIAFLFRKGLRGLFRKTARDEMLDLLVLDRYGEQRLSATPARGFAVVWMTTARDEDFLLARETAVVTPNGRALVRWDVVIPAGNTDLHLVELYSDAAGSGLGAGWGEITRFESPPATEIRISNAREYEPDGASVLAGATDAEDHERFQSRAELMWVASSRGTLKAIEYGALSTPGAGVVKAKAIHKPTATGHNRGNVFVYVSDADGGSSDAMTDAVQAELEENWISGGCQVNVYGGYATAVSDIVLELTIISPYSYRAVKQRVIEELVALGARQKPGQRLSLASLYATLDKIEGLSVLREGNDRTIVSPYGDILAADDSEVLYIDKRDITFVGDVEVP